MNLMKRYWIWIVALVLIGFFLWLRFYNIRTSLMFFNDMGRDLLVLQDWLETGKPPLLGPQTSALPINQSAIYFYMLMPAFLLTNGSPVSLLYTNAFLYIGILALWLWILRKNQKYQKIMLLIFFLITINPQYIAQSRFVWNPSFVTPFLVTSCICLFLLRDKFKQLTNLVFGFSLAMAISLSYSVAPVFIAINIFLLSAFKKNKLKMIVSQIASLLLINFTTIIFEIRHNFLLTNMLLSRGSSPQNAEDISFVAKFNSLFGFGLSITGWWLIAVVIALTAVIFWYAIKKENKELKIFSTLLALTVVITFIVPLTIHAHYIFGFATLLFLCIATLPKRPKMIVLIIMAVVYFGVNKSSGLFKTASRTYEQMTACFSRVCSEVKEPIFVSVQADFHPYHNGPEHRFMMKRAGCSVKYIEELGQEANLMAVVLDDSSFTNGVTSYNELTMFGKAKEIKRYSCQDNFGVVILQKE